MHFSDGHVNMCIATRHFPAGHVAHSYTPIIKLGHLLMSIKGDVQGKKRRRRDERTSVRIHERTTKGRKRTSRARPSLSLSRPLILALSLSPSRNACNLYYEHPGAG
jgi:hypothetical protein